MLSKKDEAASTDEPDAATEQRQKVAESMEKDKAKLEQAEIEDAGKTNKDKKKEQKAHDQKISEAADRFQ